MNSTHFKILLLLDLQTMLNIRFILDIKFILNVILLPLF